MAKKQSLESLRKKIDALDAQLIESISERARCAQEVAEVKEGQGDQAYYKPEREAQVLRRVMESEQWSSRKRGYGPFISSNHVSLPGS